MVLLDSPLGKVRACRHAVHDNLRLLGAFCLSPNSLQPEILHRRGLRLLCPAHWGSLIFRGKLYTVSSTLYTGKLFPTVSFCPAICLNQVSVSLWKKVIIPSSETGLHAGFLLTAWTLWLVSILLSGVLLSLTICQLLIFQPTLSLRLKINSPNTSPLFMIVWKTIDQSLVDIILFRLLQ